MKFVAEKNEIAGSTEQKLPRAPGVEVISAQSSGKLAADPISGGANGKTELLDSALVAGIGAQSKISDVAHGASVVAANSSDNSAAQAERVSQMVNREVVMIRQSGAKR